MTLARRQDVPIAVISLFHQIPYAGSDRLVEVFRGATSIDHLKRMVDVLCKNLNHFPTPESVGEGKPPGGKGGARGQA